VFNVARYDNENTKKQLPQEKYRKNGHFSMLSPATGNEGNCRKRPMHWVPGYCRKGDENREQKSLYRTSDTGAILYAAVNAKQKF
jgi:hypothetical protein